MCSFLMLLRAAFCGWIPGRRSGIPVWLTRFWRKVWTLSSKSFRQRRLQGFNPLMFSDSVCESISCESSATGWFGSQSHQSPSATATTSFSYSPSCITSSHAPASRNYFAKDGSGVDIWSNRRTWEQFLHRLNIVLVGSAMLSVTIVKNLGSFGVRSVNDICVSIHFFWTIIIVRI